MRPLSASELVEIWEKGVGENSVERAIRLLSICLPQSPQVLWDLNLGQRDAYLLTIHQRMFGSSLDAYGECPQCGERMEYSVSVQEILDKQVADQIPLEFDGKPLRLPNSADLAAARQANDVAAATRMIAERCAGRNLDASAIEQLSEQLAHADPLAETLIDLECTSCRHGWQVMLEIEPFLWTKISAIAKRLIGEVHVLAQAYGWSETYLLNMSAARRALYLEMVGV